LKKKSSTALNRREFTSFLQDTSFDNNKEVLVNKILVTYITNSGTTKDVADAIAEEFTKTGSEVVTLPVDQVKELTGYSAVVLGAPMILGWHRAAMRFLRQQRAALSQVPLAIFITAMSLTSCEKNTQKVVIHLDEQLLVVPQQANRLTLKERYTCVSNYLHPVLKAAPKSLVSVGIFGGRLDYYRLKWWQALFVMVVIGAKPGEKRNWPDIRAWATALPQLLFK
jgi:menaquinone-dependent protoporphyrinogen oxidase